MDIFALHPLPGLELGYSSFTLHFDFLTLPIIKCPYYYILLLLLFPSFHLTMNLTLIAWPTEELDYLPRLCFLYMHYSLSVKK